MTAEVSPSRCQQYWLCRVAGLHLYPLRNQAALLADALRTAQGLSVEIRLHGGVSMDVEPDLFGDHRALRLVGLTVQISAQDACDLADALDAASNRPALVA